MTATTSQSKSLSYPFRADGSAIARVVKSNLCVGCGVCAGLSPSELSMTLTNRGEYNAQLRPGRTWNDVSDRAAYACPFSGLGDDEDVLGLRAFGDQPDIQHSPQLGYFLRTDAAWVTDDRMRMTSSAGGVCTWLCQHLLRNGIVDGICCVAGSRTTLSLFEYQIIRRVDDLASAKKSKYYPVDLSGLVTELKRVQGRYAVVALPCFAKALRLAIQAGGLPPDRVHCLIGLFCGHLKTRQFAQYLIRSCGLHERDIVSVDFRKKLSGHSADDYAFEATARTPDGALRVASVRMRDVPLGNWGLNAFMLKACECCDDVVAEVADISFGDAWLPQFCGDGRGTNLVISRRHDLSAMIRDGEARGELALMPIAPNAVVSSQDAGFRQRRQALAYRLHLAKTGGEWRPPKRIQSDPNALKLYSRTVQHLRIKIAHATKNEFARFERCASLKPFLIVIQPLLFAYNGVYRVRKWLLG